MNGARGGYGIVGYQFAGIDDGGATPRQEHSARTTALTLGPRTGSAATATRATDHFRPRTGPRTRPKGTHHYPAFNRYSYSAFDNCEKRPCQAQPQGLWPSVCNALAEADEYDYNNRFGCPEAIKVKVPAKH